MQATNTTKAAPKLYAAIVHELLNRETFTSYADLYEAAKVACARARIPYDSDAITDAVRLVERTRTIIPGPRVLTERPPAPEVISRRTAPGVLAHLQRELKLTTSPIKTMPQVEFVTQAEADRAKAMEMVLREIEASMQRCEALEAKVPDTEDPDAVR